MSSGSISRAHILLQLRREKSRLRASEFADPYSESATSEFYHKFLMIINCEWD